MPVNLSIKSVPDALAERLRQRAARNHRSLQRELLAIVETAVSEPALSASSVLAAAPAAAAYAAHAGVGDASAPVQPPRQLMAGDDLLAELDAVVAGSRWGHAPILTREQANDRRLQRELEYDTRRAPAGPAA